MKLVNKLKKNKSKIKTSQPKKISLYELQNSPKYMGFRVKV